MKITRPCQQSGIFYYKSNMTDATSRAGTTYPSRAHDSPPFVAYICGVRVLDVLKLHSFSVCIEMYDMIFV